MNGVLPSIDALKTQAKALRRSLAGSGLDNSHSAALELVAGSFGYRDWNAIYAAVGNAPRPPVTPGQVVAGQYLSQPFLGEVTGVQALSEGRYRVVLEFEAPVDVVTFDSFSNFRSRVSKVVDGNGRSPEKTSDGVPHLVLDLN